MIWTPSYSPMIRTLNYKANNQLFIINVVIITWTVCFCVNAWAWRQRHLNLNCLITQGSTCDWDNCLLLMLLFCVVIELETWCCGSKIIENSKQKTTKQWKCPLVCWKLWHQARDFEQINPFEPIKITVMSELSFFC